MAHPRLGEIDAQWARWLDCPVDWLQRPGTHVADHASATRHRIVLSERDWATIVRCAPTDAATARAAVARLPPDRPADARALLEVLDEPRASLEPPEEVLYLAAAHFARCDDSSVVPLRGRDAEAFRALCAACSPREVELAEIEFGQPFVAGIFDGSQLVAASSFLRPGGPIADIGILSHPGYRGRGLARRAASGVVAEALRLELVPQWYALRSNAASLAIGRSLGFEHYAYDEAILLPGAA